MKKQTELKGKLSKDRLGWMDSTYQYVDGRNVGYFVNERLCSIPEGAYIKVSIEVLDPTPP